MHTFIKHNRKTTVTIKFHFKNYRMIPILVNERFQLQRLYGIEGNGKSIMKREQVRMWSVAGIILAVGWTERGTK